jgi:hypothetical protein
MGLFTLSYYFFGVFTYLIFLSFILSSLKNRSVIGMHLILSWSVGVWDWRLTIRFLLWRTAGRQRFFHLVKTIILRLIASCESQVPLLILFPSHLFEFLGTERRFFGVLIMITVAVRMMSIFAYPINFYSNMNYF